MNKPIAWINDENIVVIGDCPKDFIYSWKPLYTHPVKQLSDEGIEEIIVQEMGEFYRENADAKALCRAIIKEITE